MKLTNNNYKDIDKYFRNCYVKYPEFHGEKLFLVDRVNIEGIYGRHIGEGGEEEPYTFHLHGDGVGRSINAEFILPRKSYFNFAGYAHLLFRKPLRQYKKGICDENTKIVRLKGNGGFEDVNVSWQMLEAYVTKQSWGSVATPANASVALGPRMAIAANGQVFVDRIRVGAFENKTKTLTLGSDMFVDDFARLKQEINIVVGKNKGA